MQHAIPLHAGIPLYLHHHHLAKVVKMSRMCVKKVELHEFSNADNVLKTRLFCRIRVFKFFFATSVQPCKLKKIIRANGEFLSGTPGYHLRRHMQ